MKLLELQSVHYRINRTEILRGIDLNISTGEFLTIIGPSGSGKSTLLRLLNNLNSPTSGNILYREKNINTYVPEALRVQISYVFQKPYLFGTKVIDNLKYPFKLHSKEIDLGKISALLKELNLDEDILQKNIHSLSGGEQQRIALIRSLILEPEVLLLDEITASLDPVNRSMVEDFIKQLHQRSELTILLVTHDMQQAKGLGNRTLYMNQGKIVHDMPTESFFGRGIDGELDKFMSGQR
ncbi:putative ABC transport system ATP-binding protein [Geosporobacter subterraneus DSM 17957]|uniref:Putative ABC transport system ATP-binding protein n=1 Tax=Geosporobacter subterraneus DSM 17957 TaxID=1121919 RepID=A0A1M6D5T6_9FIRM|nr:ATP-binding cassette domain-containing protein [Geosporobacter subterraneus]SHI68473.1 putative ABC transport system ATP-binding protein [Geosporobacter subterraneus DSM 17957]